MDKHLIETDTRFDSGRSSVSCSCGWKATTDFGGVQDAIDVGMAHLDFVRQSIAEVPDLPKGEK